MRKLRLKELRITYDVLQRLDTEVPRELLVHLAERIKETEADSIAKRERKKLGQSETRKKTIFRKLRVWKDDGLMIKEKSNLVTFFHAIVDAGILEVKALNIQFGKHDLIIYDPEDRRKLAKGYRKIGPGIFIRKIQATNSMYELLSEINERLELGWKIEVY